MSGWESTDMMNGVTDVAESSAMRVAWPNNKQRWEEANCRFTNKSEATDGGSRNTFLQISQASSHNKGSRRAWKLAKHKREECRREVAAAV